MGIYRSETQLASRETPPQRDQEAAAIAAVLAYLALEKEAVGGSEDGVEYWARAGRLEGMGAALTEHALRRGWRGIT